LFKVSILFFSNGQYLGEFDDWNRPRGSGEVLTVLNLSHFQTNEQYLFEILSISFGHDGSVRIDYFEQNDSAGNVCPDGQLLLDNETKTNFWESQKG
jgi:hypothetical protein